MSLSEILAHRFSQESRANCVEPVRAFECTILKRTGIVLRVKAVDQVFGSKRFSDSFRDSPDSELLFARELAVVSSDGLSLVIF